MTDGLKIDERTAIAIEAAQKAGKVLLENFTKVTNVQSKGDRDFFTNVDLLAEEAIVDLVKSKFPQDDILSEENKYRVPEAEYGWIIDPLDGTHNYIHNIDIFGVSIAVTKAKQVISGVILMPVTKELYVAQKGRGAYCNNKRIAVSQRKIDEATMIYDSSIRYNKKPMLKGLEGIVTTVFNVRMFGSSARHLTYVAAGQAEMDIEFNDKVWDYAAGMLLVSEAGGRCTDFKGNPWSIETKDYIVSNGLVHDEVLKLLGSALQ